MSEPRPDEPHPQPPVGPPWVGVEPYPPPFVPERKRPALTAGLALLTVAVVTGLGAPLGWLWSTLAPDVPVEMTTNGPVLADPQPEQYFAADGWFTLLGLAFGLLVAVVVWFAPRRLRGPVGLLSVVLGGIGAALLGWYVGRHIGLAEYHRLLGSAPVGTRFGKPPDLRAEQFRLVYGFIPWIRGALLVPAFAAAATYTMLAGWSRYMTLRPETEPPVYPPPELSWGSADWTAPTTGPGQPGSGAAEPPRG
ncbi:DUF2567 domain-containing protein [Rhizomonospora bruguierae]|uniref:DUF2567 domain-containing protein n=1 Tax=Rhizomonospora bruguierae TaxID=1581705 RepID=UPI001BCAA016|nr:DUF2567 domain-containing protein [Micromonospora sp. NBRC 107566]